jgi:hypothetical protein
MKIRKQVYELTNDDFKSHPVWEFASDEEGEEGQDEATVRPYADGPANPGAGMLAVRAKFILADGTLMAGYLTPPIARDRGDLGIIQPQIITTTGQVSFWHGMRKPLPEDLARDYAWLGKTASEIFPLRYSSDYEVVGGSVTGTINGFLHRDLGSDEVYEIR